MSAPSEGLRLCGLLREAGDVGQDTTLPDPLGDRARLHEQRLRALVVPAGASA